MQGTWVPSLGREDPLEKEMATRSSILAWESPRTEEPGGLQSVESQMIGHDWAHVFYNSFLLLVNCPFIALWWPFLSLVIVFLPDRSLPCSLLLSIWMAYFPHCFTLSLCVLNAEASLLQAAYSWVLFCEQFSHSVSFSLLVNLIHLYVT